MVSKRKKSAITPQFAFHVIWQYKTIVLLFGLLLLGLLCLIISLVIVQNVFWSAIFSQLSTAFMISGAYTVISELLIKRDFIDANQDNFNQLANHFHLAEEGTIIGLESIIDGKRQYDESKWILESTELKILLIDGKNLVSHYSDQLRQRFADIDKKTTIILLHPESAMLAIHAKKVKSNVDALQYKIGQTIAELNQLRTKDTQLQIKGHHLYSGYSLLLSDTHAVMSPYFCSKDRRKPPTFVFKDKGGDCYYQRLKQDWESLESEAEESTPYCSNISFMPCSFYKYFLFNLQQNATPCQFY